MEYTYQNLSLAIAEQLKVHYGEFNAKKYAEHAINEIRKVAMYDQLKEESHSTDVKDIITKKFIIELDPHYVGFQSHRNMAEFVKRNSQYPIYQIIFEDTSQKLVFEYLGTEHKQLEEELSKIYPNTKIDRSYDDVVVGVAYANYRVMKNGFDQLKAQLKEIDPIMAKQCKEKPLENIRGTTKRAIKSRLVPRQETRDMISLIINYTDNSTIVNAETYINDNHGNITINQTKTREQIHKEWIEANPVREGEYSSQYYDRLKHYVTHPLSIQQHVRILRSVGYIKNQTRKGIIWINKDNNHV